MAKIQDKYEVVYIIDANKTEEEIAAMVEKFKTLIETNGTITEMEEWGNRLVGIIAEGYYVLVKFQSAPEFPAELKRILGITDGILRSLVTVSEE